MTRPLVRHPVVLTPLSPIHIGSGEELDWTRAVPDPARSQLMVFDPLRLTLTDQALNQMEQVIQGGQADSVIRLQRILSANFRLLEQGEVGRLDLTQTEYGRIRDRFGRNVQANQPGAGQVANEIAIARHALTPEGQPYVPGSSLKGALRTAEVARRDGAPRGEGPRPVDETTDRGKPVWHDPADRLLGRFADSPFARLFVSDLVPAQRFRGLVAEVRNERRRPVEGRGPKGVPVRVELIPPFIAGALRGDIREHGVRGEKDRDQKFLAVGDLLRTAHAFHLRLFDFFKGELERADRNLPPGWLGAVRQLLAEEAVASAIREGRAALVRLGKFCSAESKTVEWRAVRIPQAARTGGQEWVLHPYTLWLADLGAYRLPLGWALIELADAPCEPVGRFCERWAAEGRLTGHMPTSGFNPAVGMRVRVGERAGKIVYEEDGVFTVETDDGDEVDARPQDLRPE
ncbi:MAG: RAMP superfamily CRISPR-associated protein [Sphingomonadaceae bacterium]|uniref:RAMP superfamily CRISPR-associated protein n=1 Tax=Thermaurantiacus sp. TaxID=2820283 RepID=UPI00298EFF1B|nr:RAMP superfamily CRISPR-associated protein [Thermaurantiacus sp.]MCS6987684.1 RAMP superfamily CRISPR-associated protein [Sphingomonadaceae bacterium]MDW8415908.1 RAMP superfamily CRISPR-associated protein [Thermaurantiacus sp.]